MELLKVLELIVFDFKFFLILKYGQLGIGSTQSQTSLKSLATQNFGIEDVSCGSEHCLILKNDSTVFSFGGNNVQKNIFFLIVFSQADWVQVIHPIEIVLHH